MSSFICRGLFLGLAISLLSWPALAAGDTGANQRMIARMEVRRTELARERQHWDAFIEKRNELANHPAKAAAAALSAARDLEEMGEDARIEGLTLGISNTFKIVGAAAQGASAQRALKAAGASAQAVGTLWKTRGPNRPATAALEQTVALQKVALELQNTLPPGAKESLGGLLSVTVGSAKLLQGVLSGDKKLQDSSLASFKSMLEGSRALVVASAAAGDAGQLALIESRLAAAAPELAALAKSLPRFALEEAYIAFSLFDLALTQQYWRESDALDDAAAKIISNSASARFEMDTLMDYAHEKIYRCIVEDGELVSRIRALNAEVGPPAPALPSRRFVDDGIGIPDRSAELVSAMEALDQTVGMETRLSVAETRRREAEAAAAQRELDRQRRAELLDAAKRRAMAALEAPVRALGFILEQAGKMAVALLEAIADAIPDGGGGQTSSSPRERAAEDRSYTDHSQSHDGPRRRVEAITGRL